MVSPFVTTPRFARLSCCSMVAARPRGRMPTSRGLLPPYDRASGRVIVNLENDCAFTFPPRLAQEFEAGVRRPAVQANDRIAVR